MLSTVRFFVSLIASGALFAASAAMPVVGVAHGKGEFRIDQAQVATSGTLFDGSLIETDAARSELTLKGGSALMLIGGSRAKVYRDRMVIESGGVELSRAAGYQIEAGGLQIRGSESTARLQVAVDQGTGIRVAAIDGDAEVRNAGGVLVARVNPGMALSLNPESGAGSVTQMTGKARRVGSAILLTDDVTNVTVELRGEEAATAVGSRARVTGSILPGADAVGGAEHVVNVKVVEKLDDHSVGGVVPPISKTTGAGTTSGIGATNIAIIGGVAVAGGTMGLLYATDVIGGDDEQPVSR